MIISINVHLPLTNETVVFAFSYNGEWSYMNNDCVANNATDSDVCLLLGLLIDNFLFTGNKE